MSIIAFPGGDFSELPDIDALTLPELRELEQEVRCAVEALDKAEPKDEASEEYEIWGDRHEDLEDLLDEILDRIDDLS